MITLQQAAVKTAASINSLLPSLRQNVWNWYQGMQAQGVRVYIYFGFRSEDEQRVLYEKYRAGEGPLAAPPGKSLHNAAAALDWVPLRPAEGHEGMYEPDWDDDAAYRLGERLAPSFGLRPISQETGHLQDARFSGWEDAKRFFEQDQWPGA